ncbi:MAG: Hsp20/alpha crystallin family protein [Paludibacteraceae bacterium]|jgi:HSP20 family protein|nr:Hsp20/alpha crystallin family protein [Paludibacteraceae bacterium]
MLPVMFKNSWFPTVFDDFFNSDFMPRANSTAPAVNVKEDEKAYTMDVAAPGIKKEFCRVNINEDGNLHIAIENKFEHKEGDKKQRYLRREFSYSNYEQVYTLPDDVEKDKVSAKVENGILTVVLPKITKKEEPKIAKAIEIS